MADRPILFSAPMVRAILDGRKTQTRRVLRADHIYEDIASEAAEDFELRGWETFCRGEALCAVKAPYAVGDRLWVLQFRHISFGDGKYAVGDDGHLYDVSGPMPRRRRVRISHNGYEEITLRYRGESKAFRINRLVAEAFYGPPHEGEVCRHLNGARRDNRPENLDWGTPVQNSSDASAAGSFSGDRASQAVLSQEQVDQIRRSGEPQAILAERYSVTQPTISKIKSGKRWRALHPAAPARNRPVAFSRLTLIVSDVRVQRLQEITEEDAIAEGLDRDCGDGCCWRNPADAALTTYFDPREAYAALWSSINGPGAWEANPWVAAISFEAHKTNIDALQAPSPSRKTREE